MEVVDQQEQKTLAFWLRFAGGYNLDQQFNPLDFMENTLPKFDSKFNLRIIEHKKWELKEDIPAFCDPVNHNITLREDTYNDAMDGNGVALLTIAHEVVHYIWFMLLGIPKDIEFEIINNHKVSTNYNIELQADYLTHLLIDPEEIISDMGNTDMIETYLIKPLVKILSLIFAYISECLQKKELERIFTEEHSEIQEDIKLPNQNKLIDFKEVVA